MVFLATGSLPWVAKRPEDIITVKMECAIEEICAGLPSSFSEMLRYIRQLEFAEKPDYNYLLELLGDAAPQLPTSRREAYRVRRSHSRELSVLAKKRRQTAKSEGLSPRKRGRKSRSQKSSPRGLRHAQSALKLPSRDGSRSSHSPGRTPARIDIEPYLNPVPDVLEEFVRHP
jgi:hypothetical protein